MSDDLTKNGQKTPNYICVLDLITVVRSKSATLLWINGHCSSLYREKMQQCALLLHLISEEKLEKVFIPQITHIAQIMSLALSSIAIFPEGPNCVAVRNWWQLACICLRIPLQFLDTEWRVAQKWAVKSN